MKPLLLLLLATATLAIAQPPPYSASASGSTTAAAEINSKPAIQSGSGAASGNCTTGKDIWVNTSTGAAQLCVATNTWGSPTSIISGLTAGVLPKATSSTAIGNSSITDNGTTVSTTEPFSALSLASGASSPACTIGTAGIWCAGEGSAGTNVSASALMYPDNSAHEYRAFTSGTTSNPGLMIRAQPLSIRSTGLTAAVSTATLCAAAAGACNVSGTYQVHLALYQSGTACTANTTAGVSVQLTWTDANGTTHSAQTIPLLTNASLTATSGTMAWAQTSLGSYASADFNIDTNGTVIQYATTFSQCTTGTATYALSAVVTRLQ
jgi:hypothetical protein